MNELLVAPDQGSYGVYINSWYNFPLALSHSRKMECVRRQFEELDENVEYIEREDEFDIVRLFELSTCLFCMLNTIQEDEEDIIARKMRAEEDDVDVDGSDNDSLVTDSHIKPNEKGWQEDLRWADAYPDEDSPNWTMRIIMRDDT